MRLVVLGDMHFSTLGVWPWQLVGKRFIGQMNLWFNRRRHFNTALLGPTLARAAALRPDMVVGTGDLTTTALPREFELARTALAPLMETVPTFLVPGNHDRYTFTSHRARRFEAYFADHSSHQWPHHRQLGEGVHLIGLDVAKANVIHDWGCVGDEQLARLAALIASIPADHRLIVVCHYTLGTPPAVPPERRQHQLVDMAQLLDTLHGPRQTLYLHGHVHRPWCWRHPVASNVVTLNAGAPLMIGRPWPRGQGFWSVDIGQAWGLTRHIMDETGTWRAIPIRTPTRPNEPAELDAPDPDRPWGQPQLE